MGLMKRAWLSIRRQRNKSLILFVIIFIFGNVLVGSYAILQGTKNVEAAVKDQLSPIVSIELDNNKWTQAVSEKTTQERVPPMIRADQLKDIGRLPYVKSYDFTYGIGVVSDELETWQDPLFIGSQADSFHLIGTQYAPVMAIEEQKATLVSGRTFTQAEIDQGQNVALISQELADLNQITLDQTIVMNHKFLTWNESTSDREMAGERAIPIRIIGIINYPPGNNRLHNQLMVPNGLLDIEHKEAMEHFLAKQQDSYTEAELERIMIPNYQAFYLLRDSAELEQFVSQVESLLPEFHTIKKTSDIYARVAGPLNQADRLANQVFFVGVGAAIVIVMLITILFLRDRKYELGILMSLGESRGRIVGQILLELLLVAGLAMVLSLITGSLLSAALSESMVYDQLIQSAEADAQVVGDPWGDNYTFGVFANKITADELANRYRIDLTPQYLLLMFVLGIGTVGLAGIAPLVYIMRFNPKQVMT